MSGATELSCAVCAAELHEGDRFCEQCGARLGGDEGAKDERIEHDLTVAAAVSDRGRAHWRNEDAFGLEVSEAGRVAAVVCDGISSASSGNVAAGRAAEAAASILAGALDGAGTDSGDAVGDAIRAANGAVSKVAWTRRTARSVPSCTLVCAVCRDREITVGSVGDSRAYWIASGGARQLTVDDSWAEQQAQGGLLTFSEALRDPRAHSITNWIGSDAPDRPPRVERFSANGPGRLLLCSDGLWNYVPAAAALGRLIEALPAGAAPAAVARELTDTALLRGGRDNITVVVVDIS